MTKTNFGIFDAKINEVAINRIFRDYKTVKWQSSFDQLNNHIISIEWIGNDVEITGNTCLVCMSNIAIECCNLDIVWKRREHRVSGVICVECLDDLQRNDLRIKNLPKHTGLEDFFKS